MSVAPDEGSSGRTAARARGSMSDVDDPRKPAERLHMSVDSNHTCIGLHSLGGC